MWPEVTRTSVFVVALALVANTPFYAQNATQLTQPQIQTQSQPRSGAAGMTESKSIFCGTMHTGQLCSQGTSNVLQVAPGQRDAWLQAARKYNRAVEAATQQLFKDADARIDAGTG